MPAYNFKEQFAPMVESGQKRQTIRPKRKRPTRPGDTLYLKTGMRTKQCRSLGEAVCKSVELVRIMDGVIFLNGKALPYHERERFIRDDGFNHTFMFFDFFRRQYGLPVELELIKW